MIEKTGDMFKVKYDWYVITTNGTVKRNGACVMGRGTAYIAQTMYSKLPFQLGQMIKVHGSKVFTFPEYKMITFPVKHDWFQKADLELIKRSVSEMLEIINPHLTYCMGRPGCNNGQLLWEDVEPLVRVLPDNVFVYSLNLPKSLK